MGRPPTTQDLIQSRLLRRPSPVSPSSPGSPTHHRTPRDRTSTQVLQQPPNKEVLGLLCTTSNLPPNLLHAHRRDRAHLLVRPLCPQQTTRCSAMKSPLLEIRLPTVFRQRRQLVSQKPPQPSCLPRPTLPVEIPQRTHDGRSKTPPCPLQDQVDRGRYPKAHQMQRTMP